MSDDLITRMAEVCMRMPLQHWAKDPDKFEAGIRAEMEMLRDMVLADIVANAETEIIRAEAYRAVRKRRLSLF